MRARLERRYSPASKWSRRIGAFSVVLFVTSALAHRFALVETIPFLWLLGLCFLLAISGLLLAVMGFMHFWEHGLAGLKSAVLGAFLSALALSPYAVSGYQLITFPRLTDITTDVSRPPLFQHAPALRVPPMNRMLPVGQEERLLQVQAYPELAGRRYEYPIESVAAVVADIIADRRWRLLAPIPAGEGISSVTVEAEARSYLLGFPADVSIRIDERSNATFVDMRSVSRYGRHDMGENAARIRRFFNELDERMAALNHI